MDEIKGFIISLITAAAASALIEGFVPDSDGHGLKKYMKYLISLSILVTLLAPLRSLASALPALADKVDDSVAAFAYEDSDSALRVNSIIALHIAEAICDKFSLEYSDVRAEYDGERVYLEIKRKFGLLERDVVDYTAAKFGVEAEVIFYE